jgi:hypothetical protein
MLSLRYISAFAAITAASIISTPGADTTNALTSGLGFPLRGPPGLPVSGLTHARGNASDVVMDNIKKCLDDTVIIKVDIGQCMILFYLVSS